MLREYIKKLARRYAFLNHLAKRYYTKTRYPDWRDVLNANPDWSSLLEQSKSGKKILLATSHGGNLSGATLESLLGVALTLRGAGVHVLLCDGVLPACQECEIPWFPTVHKFVKHGPGYKLCQYCFSPADEMYRAMGFRVHRFSDYLWDTQMQQAEQISSTLPLEEISDYKLNGIAVGEHAQAGALRFYARGTLADEELATPVLRRYFKAALLTTHVMQALLEQTKFDCAVFQHGIYVPQGLVGEVCRREDVRVVNWNPAYRKKTFIFSHGDTYHHTMMSEPVDRWEDIRLTATLEERLTGYLNSRWRGSEDWIWFHENPQFDLENISREVGVDFTKPCVGLLTNVMWDAQLHYPANAFPSMLDWLLETVEYLSKRPGVQLLIRVHPAEIRGTLYSRQPIVEELKKHFFKWPSNVFIIPPDSRVSTYAAMQQCNAVIIYGTKTGIELTSQGIPVIVAGEAWIRNKGITLDATSSDHYFKLLDSLPLKHKLGAATVERARRYAYHFFFRRMIPLKSIEPAKGIPPFKIQLDHLNNLSKGKCSGLDVICDGIIQGSDFIYPAERLDS
jgi:hypothetical protein